jgi:hypothetical protein
VTGHRPGTPWRLPVGTGGAALGAVRVHGPPGVEKRADLPVRSAPRRPGPPSPVGLESGRGCDGTRAWCVAVGLPGPEARTPLVIRGDGGRLLESADRSRIRVTYRRVIGIILWPGSVRRAPRTLAPRAAPASPGRECLAEPATGLSGREGWDNTDRPRGDRPLATPSEGCGRAADGASPARLCTVPRTGAGPRAAATENAVVSGLCQVGTLGPDRCHAIARSWRRRRGAEGPRGRGIVTLSGPRPCLSLGVIRASG